MAELGSLGQAVYFVETACNYQAVHFFPEFVEFVDISRAYGEYIGDIAFLVLCGTGYLLGVLFGFCIQEGEASVGGLELFAGILQFVDTLAEVVAGDGQLPLAAADSHYLRHDNP